MQRLLPPSLVALLVIAMVVATLAVRWPELPTAMRVAGVVVLTGGMVLNVRHAKLFDSVGTNIKTFDDPDQLVTTGAFAFTRNPMYLGFALMLAGIALALGSVVAWLGPVIFVIAADRWYIPFEERRMRAVFGIDYDNYHASVKRWFGRGGTA